MHNRATDNLYRNTIVCVDSYEDDVLKGRLYNPYFEGEVAFGSVMAFIRSIESMLEQMNFPQAYEQKRTFTRTIAEEQIRMKEPGNGKKGKVATFELRIFFRQNASWQGNLHWLEEGREESFRSALELFVLMDSALSMQNVDETGIA